jgi:hypothetical protein
LFYKTTTGYTAADLALKYGSVCRNSGKNISNNIVDIKGYQRAPGLYDMGAYENYIKILTIGDGNTVGSKGATYRAYLRKKMLEIDKEVDFIGTSIAKPYLPTATSDWADVTDVATKALRDANDKEHDGDYNNSIASLIGATTANPTPTPTQISTVLTPYLNNAARANFDVLLLSVGNNDVYAANGATAAATTISTNLTSLINGVRSWIVSTAPTTSQHKFVVAKLPPVGSFDDVDANNLRDQLNSCATLVNTNTTFTGADAVADLYTGTSDALLTQINNGDEDDNLIKRYYDATGATTLADRWLPAVQTVLP